jgi:hypothetical protein
MRLGHKTPSLILPYSKAQRSLKYRKMQELRALRETFTYDIASN